MQLEKGLRVRACVAAEQHQSQNKVPQIQFLLLYNNINLQFPYLTYTPIVNYLRTLYLREGSE